MNSINRFVLLFLCLITIVSCGKKEESDGKKEVEINEPLIEDLIMTIEFKYGLEDTFKVYYSKENTTIDGSLLMEEPVYESTGYQKVNFIFPQGDFPKIIRLDVGNKQEAENIEIKSIIIKYGDKIIDKSDWVTTQNWSPNESLQYDEASKSYKIVAVNGQKTPVFISNIIIQEKLKNLLNKK